jgi:hypothetical protein
LYDQLKAARHIPDLVWALLLIYFICLSDLICKSVLKLYVRAADPIYASEIHVAVWPLLIHQLPNLNSSQLIQICNVESAEFEFSISKCVIPSVCMIHVHVRFCDWGCVVRGYQLIVGHIRVQFRLIKLASSTQLNMVPTYWPVTHSGQTVSSHPSCPHGDMHCLPSSAVLPSCCELIPSWDIPRYANYIAAGADLVWSDLI